MTVINLNKTRKAKARAEEKIQADANAVKFGRTKGEKAGEAVAREQKRQKWDGHEKQ
jgi:Domain of unknown function (DUF4169)